MSPAVLWAIVYLYSYHLPPIVVNQTPIYQILVQANITFLGFYLLIMTYVIKKYEDSTKEYGNMHRTFDRGLAKWKKIYNREHAEIAKNLFFHNTPLFQQQVTFMKGITSQEDLNDIMKNKDEFENKVRLVQDFSKTLTE